MYLCYRSIFSEVDIVRTSGRKDLVGIDIAGWFHSKLSLEMGKDIDLRHLAIVSGKHMRRIEGRTILEGNRMFCLLDSILFLELGRHKRFALYPRILVMDRLRNCIHKGLLGNHMQKLQHSKQFSELGIHMHFVWYPRILEMGTRHSSLHTFPLGINTVDFLDSIGSLELGKSIGSLSNPRLLEQGMAHSYHRKDLCRKRIGYRSRVFLGQDTHICSLRNPIFLDLGKVSIAIQNILLDTHNCM